MRFVTFLFKNLIRRPVRTVLTCLGIAIAIGTMMALLGIADGFERAINTGFQQRGEDIVVQQKGVWSPEASDIAEEAAQRVGQMTEVLWVAPTLVSMTSFEMADGSFTTTMLQGWPAERIPNAGWKTLAGEVYTEADAMKKVAVLGQRVAEASGKGVGDTIPIEDEDFEIVAIIDSYISFEDHSIIIPLAEMQTLQFREGRVSGFSVKLHPEYAEERDAVQNVIDRINTLRDENDTSYRLSATRADEYVGEQEQMKQAKAMIWLTSAIAVLLGAVGVLNTMVMSVVERQREISVVRAIGWKKRRVMAMVLGESLLLTIAGAALGALFASGLVLGLTALPFIADYIPAYIAWPVLLQGLALSLIVGLIGGVYPAIRAARVLPSVGLRHE